MATSGIAFGSGNGNREIDVIDIAALIVLPITASMIFEVFSLEINVFSGYNLTEGIWTIGGADISVALLVTVFAIAWVFGTNLLNGETDLEGIELGAVVTALLLPLGYVFVPAVADLVMWHDLMQLAALLYVSVATIVVSYMG